MPKYREYVLCNSWWGWWWGGLCAQAGPWQGRGLLRHKEAPEFVCHVMMMSGKSSLLFRMWFLWRSVGLAFGTWTGPVWQYSLEVSLFGLIKSSSLAEFQWSFREGKVSSKFQRENLSTVDVFAHECTTKHIKINGQIYKLSKEIKIFAARIIHSILT